VDIVSSGSNCVPDTIVVYLHAPSTRWNRAIFHECMGDKRCLHFRFRWPWPL